MDDFFLLAKLLESKRKEKRVGSDIASAYTACENKGATLPATQNSANLANTIDSIPTGGGGGDVVENPALRLMDWEGTILKEYSKEDALALETLPDPSTLSAYANVDHEYLLFQEWNWSLADIKAWVQNHEGFTLLVGANYTTTDGEDHYYLKSPRLNAANSVSVKKCGITSIGSNAFQHYYSLTSITIPNSVTNIGGSAFADCCSLTSITIPNSVTSINVYAFYNCYSLISITIPNSVTSINVYAFQRCYSLTSITIPNSVTNIGSKAFADCYSLASITIPNSVTNIGDNAFQYCYSLASITIPNSVTNIGTSAFQYCYSLASITIPNSVTNIGDNAFDKCTSLCDILYTAFQPTLSNTNAFERLPSIYRIYVPSENLSWYETATNWSTIFAQGHIVAIEDYINYLESIGFNVDAYKGGAA